MNDKHERSFGEMVDIMTLLRIKLKRCQNDEDYKIISSELNVIKTNDPDLCKEDILFHELSEANHTLCDMKANIREKSQKEEFDNQYVQYADWIRVTNEKRQDLIKMINDKYKSKV